MAGVAQQDAGYRTGFVQLFHRNRLVRSHVSREIKRIDAEKPDLVFVSLFVDRLDGTKQVTKAVRLLNSVMERQLKGGRQLLIFGHDNASAWCNADLATTWNPSDSGWQRGASLSGLTLGGVNETRSPRE